MRLTEAQIQKTCSDFLALDGWRVLITNPCSDKARGKGFGEVGMSIPDDELLTLHLDIEEHMDKVAAMFAPGAQVTLVVHFPGLPEKGLCLGDDIEGAIEQVRHLQGSNRTKVIEPMRTVASQLADPAVVQDAMGVIHKPMPCAGCFCSQTLPNQLQSCLCACHPSDRRAWSMR
jgi:hypothetical protein